MQLVQRECPDAEIARILKSTVFDQPQDQWRHVMPLMEKTGTSASFPAYR